MVCEGGGCIRHQPYPSNPENFPLILISPTFWPRSFIKIDTNLDREGTEHVATLPWC